MQKEFYVLVGANTECYELMCEIFETLGAAQAAMKEEIEDLKEEYEDVRDDGGEGLDVIKADVDDMGARLTAGKAEYWWNIMAKEI